MKLERIVEILQAEAGMAVLELPSTTSDLHKSFFETARQAFDVLDQRADATHKIQSEEDSAHVTGYHPASITDGMSRYNAHREGFVFSDGGMLTVEGVAAFESHMNAFFDSLHSIAQNVLTQMEKQWDLPTGWFQDTLGPTREYSQWHVKQYVVPEDGDIDWLPMHTDPSIISIVVHDVPGKEEGAMGLEYQTPMTKDRKKEWRPVPHHGHDVATVFIGSVLSYMTGATVNSCKHRVVATQTDQRRIAATLFLRPRGTALLIVPPSPQFDHVTLRKMTTFDKWSARVSRNYMKNKPANERTKPKKSRNDGYFQDDWTEMSLISCDPPLTGREKFLGGELGGNGKIYTIPGFAPRVLVIDPNVEPPTVKAIGPSFPGEYKWLRSARVCTGIIYGIPCHADFILRIDPETDTVSTIAWDNDNEYAPPKGMPWKWHGGNVSPYDNCLYFIPQYAEYVLKIDPVTEKITFLNGSGPLLGRNKWYGGILSPIDGAIYGINQNATGVLRIDPTTQSVTVHGNFPENRHLWHGGVAGPNGCIYGIPANADSVLKIEPGLEPRLTTIGGPLRSGEHRSDGKYKYLGAVVGHDGNIYFFPSDSEYVLQINPRTDEVREVGPNIREIEAINNNKWQNGFAAPDGSIYGIPLKSGSVLRIRPGEDGSNPDVTTIGGPFPGLNKWEGGVMSKDGDIFCMPLNHSQVLRIKPKETEPSKNLPQVATLRSSAHTLRYSRTRAKGLGSGPCVSSSSPFPEKFRMKRIINYNSQKYDLRRAVTNLLSQVDPTIIGRWNGEDKNLEHFKVPNVSLQPSRPNNPSGNGEKAQQALSDLVANDEEFVTLFDDFLSECIIPWLKNLLVQEGIVNHQMTTFYYQRPPTLRIQPGPSTRYVRPHKDADYGHQDGELNFWMPLTDPSLTQTDLCVETSPGNGDYVPLGVKLGEVASFHGSSCMHYVPANPSTCTRVSLDFRVGVKGFFDPNWTMLGTVSDHNRREVSL